MLVCSSHTNFEEWSVILDTSGSRSRSNGQVNSPLLSNFKVPACISPPLTSVVPPHAS